MRRTGISLGPTFYHPTIPPPTPSELLLRPMMPFTKVQATLTELRAYQFIDDRYSATDKRRQFLDYFDYMVSS